MRTIEASYTRVFAETAASQKRVVLNVGGARSSKSYSIAQLFVSRFLSEQKKTSIISRKTFPALRATAMHDVLSLMQDWGVYSAANHNKSENTIVNPRRGNVMRFISINDPTRIRSMQSNYTWMEEANEFTFDDYVTLKTRLSSPSVDGRRNQMFLSLNPSDPYGWINQKLVPMAGRGGDEVELIHSTHRDNPALADDYRKILADLKSEDETYYKIYSEGEWAQASNIIYSRYDIVPRSRFPSHFDEVLVGLDFGYNNPAAAIFCGILDGEPWIHELVYKTQLTNNALIGEVRAALPAEFHSSARLRADEAEPDRIEEFRQAGFQIEPARKGKSSIRDGIDWCKRMRWHISEDSPNVIKEVRGYKWREDNQKGLTLVLDEPVKYLDHSMDAIRYALTGLKAYEASSSWPQSSGGPAAGGLPEWAT